MQKNYLMKIISQSIVQNSRFLEKKKPQRIDYQMVEV